MLSSRCTYVSPHAKEKVAESFLADLAHVLFLTLLHLQVNDVVGAATRGPVVDLYQGLKTCACCTLGSELFTQWMCVTISGYGFQQHLVTPITACCEMLQILCSIVKTSMLTFTRHWQDCLASSLCWLGFGFKHCQMYRRN
eukprot:1158995-Pelagomonas_calceolata.AAC.1